jgi:cytochrome c5
MKSKIIFMFALSAVLFSCGTKTAVTQTVAKVDTKPVLTTNDLAAGKTSYENNCAKCHNLYAASDFTKEDWKPIMIRMQKKAHLDDAQMAEISNYIYSQL